EAREQAASLTRQMLAYAGKGRFIVQPVNMSSLVRDMETLLKAALPKHISLRMLLAEDLPSIEADVSQMQQLVMNLAMNAAESIEAPSGGSVLIATEVARLNDKFIQADVAGAGIQPGFYFCLKTAGNGPP